MSHGLFGNYLSKKLIRICWSLNRFKNSNKHNNIDFIGEILEEDTTVGERLVTRGSEHLNRSIRVD